MHNKEGGCWCAMSASADDNRAEDPSPCFVCEGCRDDLTELPAETNADVTAAYAAVLKARSDQVVNLMKETTAGVMLFQCPLRRHMSDGTMTACGISAYC